MSNITFHDLDNYKLTYKLLSYKGKIYFYYYKKLIQLVDDYRLNQTLVFKGSDKAYKVQLDGTTLKFYSEDLKVIHTCTFTENDKRKIYGLLNRLRETLKNLHDNYHPLFDGVF